MDAHLKIKLSMLPLLACSTLAFAAEPVLLNASDMDRVTAGAQPLFGNIVGNLFGSLPVAPPALNLDNWIPLTLGQLTFIKQLIGNEPAALREVTAQGDSVATYQLKPGETLQIRQANSNGVNYAYIRSTGNTAVRISQVTGMLTQ